jgi:branched-chain amino acid transport system permease protein
MLFDIVITSLIKGSTYAMLAIGFSMIFGVARIVNIAHTAFYMVAAYCIFYTTTQLGFNPVLAILAAVILVAVLGMVTFKLLIAPIREHEAAVLIATIALAIALQEVMMILFTGDYRSVPPLVPGFATFMGAKIFYQQLLTFGSVVVVLGLMWLFLLHTKLGLAIRATAQDREVANLMGMNESQVAMYAMGISVGLAGLTGAVLAPLTIVEPHMWNHPLAMMLAVVVLGGLGSIKGSFYAAFILGTAETMVVFLVPAGAYLKGAVALSIMVSVLLVRPAGLFGVQFEEER